jgi:hypothetical protein
MRFLLFIFFDVLSQIACHQGYYRLAKTPHVVKSNSVVKSHFQDFNFLFFFHSTVLGVKLKVTNISEKIIF